MYEWRFALKEGDLVDIFDENYTWSHGKIAEIRREEQSEGEEGEEAPAEAGK